MCVKGSDILLVSVIVRRLELARELLQEVERAQGIHVADRDRLLGLLA